MSLFLLLDEDSQSKYLARLLKGCEHDVMTVNEAGITGASDAKVLDYCRQVNRILLTRNCDDFQVLHQLNPIHPGNSCLKNQLSSTICVISPYIE